MSSGNITMYENTCLKIVIYQNFCNYRIEKSYGFIQTYPLPTPSMIRGWIHAAAEFKRYYPLDISIQGENYGIVTNMQRVYKFDIVRVKSNNHAKSNNGINNTEHSEDNNLVYVSKSTKGLTKQRVITGIQMANHLINVHLIIHVRFLENINYDEIIEKLWCSTPVLGRNDDLGRIDELNIVKFEQCDEDNAFSKKSMYVMPHTTQGYQGTKFLLPFYYHSVHSRSFARIFEHVEVMYIPKDIKLLNEMCFLDEDGDIIQFLSCP